MMLMSRLKWLVIPLALGAGAAGGMIVTRQVMIRSIEARDREKAGEIASAQAPKPPAAETDDPFEVPLPRPGRSPFELDPQPKMVDPPAVAFEEDEIKAVPPVVLSKSGFPRFEIGEVPPGYFDLPAPDKKDGTDPPIIKVGQVLQVEVLEALNGRPISGERVVRPDGTISLGFYGDLKVAGLNRYQIKVKVIELLRKFLNDDILGLIRVDKAKKVATAIPPVETNRVFVDESPNYRPPEPGPEKRPQPKAGDLDEQIARGRLSLIEERIRKAVEILEARQAGPKPANPPDPKDHDAVRRAQFEQMDDELRLIMIKGNLSASLKELEGILRQSKPGRARGPGPGQARRGQTLASSSSGRPDSQDDAWLKEEGPRGGPYEGSRTVRQRRGTDSKARRYVSSTGTATYRPGLRKRGMSIGVSPAATGSMKARTPAPAS